MPSRLDTPVLTVDVDLIHKVDTRNVENLFSMWTVFSRCAGSLEEGRRLENLSWRLWNRETFCCDPVSEANSTTPAISISSRSPEGRYSSEDVPSLSGSLDSLPDEEAIEFESDNTSSSTSAPVDITRPQIQRQDSVHSRSRGRERHITPDALTKMVITIKEKKSIFEPLASSTCSYLSPDTSEPITSPTATVASQPFISTAAENKLPIQDSAAIHPPLSASSDTTSLVSERSTTSVVMGFSPSHIRSPYRTVPTITAPSSIPSADIAAAEPSKVQQPKKHIIFAVGGSSGEESMSEQMPSVESTPYVPQQEQQLAPKRKGAKFTMGASSNEDESSLPQKMKSQGTLASKVNGKKQTSFLEEVATRVIREEQCQDSDVFESDDEDDIDESAIDDDDDSSDWEDSVEDSGTASIDEKTFFQRVDSRPNLTTRPSLITTLLHQSDRKNALAQAATTSMSTPTLQRSSRTTSPNGPSLAVSPDSDEASGLMMKNGLKSIPEVPRSAAQPIIQTTTNTSPHLALSPRTTRRNMLASELTVSLRQHLLWERKQKSQTVNAVLKRRHTAHDIANLKQYPEKAYMTEAESKEKWNEYYGQGLGEYHSRGW